MLLDFNHKLNKNIPFIIFFHNIRERDAIIWPVKNFGGRLFYDLDVPFSTAHFYKSHDTTAGRVNLTHKPR